MMEICSSGKLCLWLLLLICWCPAAAGGHAEEGQHSAMMLKELKAISKELSLLGDILGEVRDIKNILKSEGKSKVAGHNGGANKWNQGESTSDKTDEKIPKVTRRENESASHADSALKPESAPKAEHSQTPGKKSSCEDKKRKCSAFARKGYCETKRVPMHKYCKRSCKVCLTSAVVLSQVGKPVQAPTVVPKRTIVKKIGMNAGLRFSQDGKRIPNVRKRTPLLHVSWTTGPTEVPKLGTVRKIGMNAGLRLSQDGKRIPTVRKRTPLPAHTRSTRPTKVFKTTNIKKIDEETNLSFTLKEKLTIYRLIEFGVPIEENKPLLLKMNVCHGIVVAFMKTYKDPNNRYMSVWVGVKGITKVFDCLNNPQGSCTSKPVVSKRSNVWNCKGSADIWLKWTNTGYVSAGTGTTPGENVLVEYQGKERSSLVNYIGLVLLEDTNVQGTAKTVGSPCKDSYVGKTEDDGMVAFTMKAKMKLYRLNDYGVSITAYKSLVMKIEACKGIAVAFMKYYNDPNNRYISVWIGVHDETKVFDCLNGSPGHCSTNPVYVSNGKVWTCKGYTDLWLQWSNTGFVSAGKGLTPGKDTLVKYQGPNKMTPVNYIGAILLKENNVSVKMKTVCQMKEKPSQE